METVNPVKHVRIAFGLKLCRFQLDYMIKLLDMTELKCSHSNRSLSGLSCRHADNVLEFRLLMKLCITVYQISVDKQLAEGNNNAEFTAL